MNYFIASPPVALADLAAKPERDLDCEVVAMGRIGWVELTGEVSAVVEASLWQGLRCSAIGAGRGWGPLRLYSPRHRHRHRSRSIRQLAPERPGRSSFAGISTDGGQHIGRCLDLSFRRPRVFVASDVLSLAADVGPNRHWPVGRPW